MNNFTPVSALIGSLLIGLAASMLLWLNGRIAGISGILGNVLSKLPGYTAWRLLFLTGLVIGAGGYVALTGDSVITSRNGVCLP
jgi:uncharacterized membrane protein YedE/YeeE